MPNEKPRILFCSYHAYPDPSSGAALATRDLLELLVARGWVGGVLCGPHFDFEDAASVGSLLIQQGLTFETQTSQVGDLTMRVYHVVQNGVPVTLFEPSGHHRSSDPDPKQGNGFLQLFERVRTLFQPDVMITYGGHWLARELIARAKSAGIRVVFTLRNFAYRDPSLFELVDATLVPSEYSRDYYRRSLGIESVALPGPWNWDRIRCRERNPQFVTFVNPQPSKGVFVFARIASELARNRSDIPFLVVEGRGTVDWLGRTGVDWEGVTTVHRMANTSDPRNFYEVSRLVLMPSLWRESLGRVPAESLINGIPVLASRRGALPETVGDAGILFTIPAHYTPASRIPPTAREVTPWVVAIQRLWDDPDFYQRRCRQCEVVAAGWHPNVLLPRFEEFFHDLMNGR